MVTRDSKDQALPKENEPHMIRLCKRHGGQHSFFMIGEQCFCLLCLQGVLNTKIGVLGPEELCTGSTSPK